MPSSAPSEVSTQRQQIKKKRDVVLHLRPKKADDKEEDKKEDKEEVDEAEEKKEKIPVAAVAKVGK